MRAWLVRVDVENDYRLPMMAKIVEADNGAAAIKGVAEAFDTADFSPVIFTAELVRQP